MDQTDVAQALLSSSRRAVATAQHQAEVDAHAAGLPLPHFVLSGTHPTHIQPHQFRELGNTEGPSIITKFNARTWTFHSHHVQSCCE